MPAANANSQPLSENILKEIEIAALSKAHETVIQDFENDPVNFKNFKALKYIEYNVRSLADDYMNKVKKNLVPHTEHMVTIAKRFAFKRSIYDIIVRQEKDKEFLRNDIIFEMLKKSLKDCQNSAYILATNRSQTRVNAVHEELVSGNAVIQQRTACLPNIQDQVTSINESMQLIQAQLRANNPETRIVQENNPPTNRPIANPNPPIPEFVAPNQNNQPGNPIERPHVLQNANGPSWIISQRECQDLKDKHKESGPFLREYLQKLFSLFEILEPITEVSREKQSEAIKVCHHFYGTDSNWDQLFESIMRSLRGLKRRVIFKKIDKKEIGYAFTNTGIVFYFKRPISSAMEFFSNEHASCRDRQTKLIGNYKVPKKCGEFDYIVFIEKSDRYAKFYKLFKDGSMMKMKN